MVPTEEQRVASPEHVHSDGILTSFGPACNARSSRPRLAMNFHEAQVFIRQSGNQVVHLCQLGQARSLKSGSNITESRRGGAWHMAYPPTPCLQGEGAGGVFV